MKPFFGVVTVFMFLEIDGSGDDTGGGSHSSKSCGWWMDIQLVGWMQIQDSLEAFYTTLVSLTVEFLIY